MEKELVDVILNVFNKVFHIQFDDKKEILLHLINNAIANIEDEKHFRIKVAGDNVSFLEKHKDEILDLIKEIRLKLPDELKQAKWVKEERQRILAEAQKEADGIVKEAENRIISMIDEHEITRKAYEQKAEIIETANEMSREISQGTKEYANNLLNSTEKVLTDSLAKLEKDISEAANIMQMSLEGTIKTIQDSKKELQ